jgi:hypothetical protein
MGILSDLDFQQIQGGQQIGISNYTVWGEESWLVIGVVVGYSGSLGLPCHSQCIQSVGLPESAGENVFA